MSDIIVAIDSSLCGCGIALGTISGDFIDSHFLDTQRGQAEFLVPIMDKLIKDNGYEYKNISEIRSTIGPGSFTGIRIGLSVAKILALSLNIKGKGVRTSDVMLSSVVNDKIEFNNIAIILETRRKDYYYASFNKNLSSIVEISSVTEDFIVNELTNEYKIIGDGCKRFLSNNKKSESLYVGEYDFIKTKDILKLCPVVSTHPLEPLYLRDADVSTSKKIIRKIECE